jgi:hypothetical protein
LIVDRLFEIRAAGEALADGFGYRLLHGGFPRVIMVGRASPRQPVNASATATSSPRLIEASRMAVDSLIVEAVRLGCGL